MRSETATRVFLILFSSILSLVVFIGAGEWFAEYRYERWKAAYENSEEWYGGLTIASDNSTLMWEYRANGVYQDGSLEYSIRTNRFGFRGPDNTTQNKSAGVLRYAFIGDSVTLGLKVKEEDTFVTRFAELFNRLPRDRRLEALNFGVDGYNTIQIAEQLEKKVLGFDPDKVIYVLSLNDFDFEDSSGQKTRFFKQPKSFFLSSMARLYRRLPWFDYYDYHFGNNKAMVFQQIRRMKGLLEARDIDFEVVVIPVFRQSDPDFAHYPLAAMHREIKEELARMKITSFDLLQVFSTLGATPTDYSHDEWHPNSKGHQVIATSIYQNMPNYDR